MKQKEKKQQIDQEMLQFRAIFAVVPVKSKINVVNYVSICVVMLVGTKVSSYFICSSVIERK